MWALLETHPRFKSESTQSLAKVYGAALRDLEITGVDLTLIRSTRNRIAHGDLVSASQVLDTAHSQLRMVLEAAFGDANFPVFWSIQQELWKRDFSSRNDRQCLLNLFETTLGGLESDNEFSKLVHLCLGRRNYNFCRVVRNRASHPAPPPSSNEVNNAIRMLEKARSEAMELHRQVVERQLKEREAARLRDEERARQVEREEIEKAIRLERQLIERQQREESARLEQQRRAEIRDEEKRRRDEEQRRRDEEREQRQQDEIQRQVRAELATANHKHELETTKYQAEELASKVIQQFVREYRHRHAQLRSQRRRLSALVLLVSAATLVFVIFVVFSLPVGTNDIIPAVISLSMILSLACGVNAQLLLATRLRLERQIRRTPRDDSPDQISVVELLNSLRMLKPRHVRANDTLYEATRSAREDYYAEVKELVGTLNSLKHELATRIEPRQDQIIELIGIQFQYGLYPIGLVITIYSALLGGWIGFLVVAATVVAAIELLERAASEEPGDSAIKRAEKLLFL